MNTLICISISILCILQIKKSLVTKMHKKTHLWWPNFFLIYCFLRPDLELINYRLFRFKTDWQTAVLRPFLAIFCQLYEHLSLIWDSDGQFEVLNSFKSWLVLKLWLKKQIFPFPVFCDFVRKESFAFSVFLHFVS